MENKNPFTLLISLFKYNKRIFLKLFLNYYLLKLLIKNKKHHRPKKIKKIVFLVGKSRKDNIKEHLVMVKGFYPSRALRKKGILSEFYINHLPKNINNSMIVFIKYFPFKEVNRAIKNNCFLVYEVMDEHKPCSLENEKILCDAIIFPNKKMKGDFKNFLPERIKSFVMYHHWDPRLDVKNIKNKNNKFSIAYFGSNPKKNAIYHNELYIPVFSKFSDHLKYKNKFTCLYSMRKEGSIQFLYKPSTKIATAAAIGANIITSKEPSAIEILGKNYPYLTDTDFESVKKTVEYAKRTFGKKIWNDALKTMKKIKKESDINKIVESYVKIRDNFNNNI